MRAEREGKEVAEERRRDGERQRLRLRGGGAALVCADDVSAPAVSLQSQTI